MAALQCGWVTCSWTVGGHMVTKGLCISELVWSAALMGSEQQQQQQHHTPCWNITHPRRPEVACAPLLAHVWVQSPQEKLERVAQTHVTAADWTEVVFFPVPYLRRLDTWKTALSPDAQSDWNFKTTQTQSALWRSAVYTVLSGVSGNWTSPSAAVMCECFENIGSAAKVLDGDWHRV